MKKIILTSLFLILVGVVLAQVDKKVFSDNHSEKKSIGATTCNFVKNITKSTNILLSENFENGSIPSTWSKLDGDCGWTVSENGSSSNLTFPSHSKYAFVNDDACGNTSDMNNVCLMTPSMDFSGTQNVVLTFMSYAPSNQESYKILASENNGIDWTSVKTIVNDQSSWVVQYVDLSSYAGKSNVLIAFQYSDKNTWAFGWAIDDILIYEQNANDLSMESCKNLVTANGCAYYPTMSFRNVGTEFQGNYSLSVVISKEGQTLYSSTKSMTEEYILSGSTKDITMDDVFYAPLEAGDLDMKAFIKLENDEDRNNDTIDCALTVNNYKETVAYGFKNYPTPTQIGNFYIGSDTYNQWNAGLPEEIDWIFGVDFLDGKPYVIDDYGWFGYYDIATNKWVKIKQIILDVAFVTYNLSSLVYDSERNKFHTICRGGGKTRFVEIDPVTGSNRFVGDSLQLFFKGMARDSSGKYYAINWNGSENGKAELYTFDIYNKTYSKIGDLGGRISDNVNFMNIDKETNTFYLEAFSEVPTKFYNGTYTVDLTTGKASPFGLPHEYIVQGFAFRGDKTLNISNNEQLVENSLSIYPNPSSGNFSIVSANNAVVSIIDISGRIISKFTVNANETKLINQSKGLYLVKVESANSSIVRKLIVQ